MRKEDYREFTDLLTAVFMYYGKTASRAIIDIYWEGLKDLTIEEVKFGFSAHARNPDTGQFLPKIADIRRMALGSSMDAAYIAWTKVDRAIRHVGPYSDVVFDDPIIHHVIHEMGGWIALSMKNDREWDFVAHEFRNRYRGYAARGGCPEYPKVLTGISNADNSRMGFRLEPPRMIGDHVACNRVMLGGSGSPSIGLFKPSAALHAAKMLPGGAA